jgi:hypothetical protein
MNLDTIFLAPISQDENSDFYNKLFLQKEGSDFVSVKLSKYNFTANGIGNMQLNSALMRIPAAMLPVFLKQAAGVNIDSTKNAIEDLVPTKLEGIIQVQKSFEPFYMKSDGSAQDAVTRPDGSEVLRDGKQYYRQTVFTTDKGQQTEVWGTNEADEEGRIRFTAGATSDGEVIEQPQTAKVEAEPTV